ncbi:putative capsid protein [Mongoose-associated circovirus]|nr:putative capsid protein [Mongoose-associated circovirus]
MNQYPQKRKGYTVLNNDYKRRRLNQQRENAFWNQVGAMSDMYQSRGNFRTQAAFKKEKMGVDTAVTSTGTISTTGTNADCILLNGVQQGTGSYNRNGKKIVMKSLRLRCDLSCVMLAAATTADMGGKIVRVVVVYDKQPTGALPTFDTVFGNTTQDGTETCQYSDGLRYDNTLRFSVVMDETVKFDPNKFITGGSSNTQTQYSCFDRYVKLKNLETVYSGTANPVTIANISTGALYVYMRTNAGTTNASVNIGNGPARLRYYD